MTKEKFLNFIKRLSVYKFKDTYMFGNYDYDNAVFVNRVTSSPSSKQFLAEAIPAIVDSGLDFIHFVPKDVRDKYKRSGYTVSTRGFRHNLRGEEMTKYLATSNPNIVSRIFGKQEEGILNSKGDIGVLTGAELKEYNDSTFDIVQSVPKGEVINTPVNIDGASIKKAGKDTSKVLETYLKSFGIKVKDINEIKSKLAIDDIGFADILNKIAYVKDRDALPDVAGEFIAYMMQYNPLVKDIIRELAGTTDYRSIKDKDKYFKIVGKLINEDLRNKSKGEYSKSLLGKIAQLVKQFFKTLREGVNIELINTNIGIITNNILQQNVDLITGNKYKPGEYGKPTKLVTIEQALETDKFGSSIVKRLSKEGFILTGSTALAEQGTVLRPEENPLHDIDWISPFTRTETKSKFEKVYPDAVFLRDIEGEGYVTDTYMLPPAGYKISNFRTVTVQAKDGTNRVMLENYDVVNKKTGKVEGTYRIETTDYVGKDEKTYTKSEEVIEGVEAKAIDFFSYEKYNQKKPFDYTTKDGDVIQLANWTDVFTAKLKFARLKDLWDYNRYIPNVVEEDAQPTTAVDITSPKNVFTIKPLKGRPDKKATTKSKIATQYIGFAEGIAGSSTANYAQQAGLFANTGSYGSNDVIFVSIGGKRGSAKLQKSQQDRTIREAIKAVEAGATILTDNKAYTDSSTYNTGEKRLYESMEAQGYNYSEVTVDGETIGTWSKTTQPTAETGTLGEINYTIDRNLKNKNGTKRLAGTDGKTIKLNPVESVDEFFEYFTGAKKGITSEQKKQVLKMFDDFNISLDDMKKILNTTDKINDFLVYHEQNHIDNNDISVYWKEGKDLLTPDKLKIEFRATYEALRRVMNEEEKARFDISIDLASQYYADQGGYQVGNGPFIKFTGKTCT